MQPWSFTRFCLSAAAGPSCCCSGSEFFRSARAVGNILVCRTIDTYTALGAHTALRALVEHDLELAFGPGIRYLSFTNEGLRTRASVRQCPAYRALSAQPIVRSALYAVLTILVPRDNYMQLATIVASGK